jgi:hypothetical protein
MRDGNNFLRDFWMGRGGRGGGGREGKREADKKRDEATRF